jgi:Putative motility protein
MEAEMNVNTGMDTAMAAIFNQSPKDEVGIAVLKKALETQAQNAQALINAVPQPPKAASSNNLPPNLGQNINTKA